MADRLAHHMTNGAPAFVADMASGPSAARAPADIIDLGDAIVQPGLDTIAQTLSEP